MKIHSEINIPKFTLRLPFIKIEWAYKENKISVIFMPFNL